MSPDHEKLHLDRKCKYCIKKRKERWYPFCSKDCASAYGIDIVRDQMIGDDE